MSDSNTEKSVSSNPASTVAAVATRRSEGVLHVLLIRRAAQPFKDMWSLPCDRIQQFEWSYDAVVRGVREQAGLAFKGKQFGDEIFPDLGIHNVVAAYAGSVAGKLKTDESKVSDVKWVSLDSAREMSLAFEHERILDAFARWNTRNRTEAKEGLLDEFRALRGEMTSIFNARLWGTATYLVLVLGIMYGLEEEPQPFHWLFLIYASIPFILHTAYRERARIRAGVYIKEQIEPYIRGLDWENFVDEWRCSLSNKEGKPIIDRLLHMGGIGGLYALVVAVAGIKCLTPPLKTLTASDSRALGFLILAVSGLMAAGAAPETFFSIYKKTEKNTRDACNSFDRDPPVY